MRVRGAGVWALAAFLLAATNVLAGGEIAGVVTDGTGAPVAGARLTLMNAERAGFGATTTGPDGRFRFDGVPDGDYVVVATRQGFSDRRVLAPAGVTDLRVELDVAPLVDEVTVTAEAGRAVEVSDTAQAVNVVSEEQVRRRFRSVLAEVVNEEPGLALQRTSPTIAGVFVRGLTGKNVAVFVDGVRYTTSAQRGGINTFFDLNDPFDLVAVEVLRGPNSAQYGSDSLGGTVHLVSRVPSFGDPAPQADAELTTYYSSPANAFGSTLRLSYGAERFGVSATLSGRRINTLRSGGGLDGHAAVTRFLGLPSGVIGETRLPDTAFTQYGGTLHLTYAPTPDDQFIAYYQRGQQDGGKRYDQLLGGDGNLIADLRNLMLDFGYVRYHRQGLGPFDSGTFTVSYNAQREERVNQGGQGNPLGSITSQPERTRVGGFGVQLEKRLGEANDALLGADLYHERVTSPAFTTSPATGAVAPSRPRVPNGARYLAYGFFAQDVWEAVPERVRVSGAFRYNVASYRSRASESPLVGGRPLFPDDSLRAADASGRVGVVASPWRPLAVSFNYSRGFRAPNVTDLGTLGLTGDGFEVAAADVAGLGGTVGTTADDTARSTGLPVERLRSETTDNFDLGVRAHGSRFDAGATAFLIDFDDTITKQALVLPQGAVGTRLGDQVVVRQLPNGVVFVPASSGPVLARANFGPARISGFEAEARARIARDWTLEANTTYIRAEDRTNGQAPNIEGGTPPANGFAALRYAPAARRFWAEAYATLADAQRRLSSLDVADRRTGARRSRSSVAAFFANGARARGLTGPGPDGRFGTADDVLLATGETLGEVQARVLGASESAPLFRTVPGYGLIGLRGGVRFGERSDLFVDFSNIADKSYRGISWGIDGPGRGVTVQYRVRF